MCDGSGVNRRAFSDQRMMLRYSSIVLKTRSLSTKMQEWLEDCLQMIARLEKSNRDPARRFPYDIVAILSRTYAEAHGLERRTDATESLVCPSLAGVSCFTAQGHSNSLNEYAYCADKPS